MVRKIQEIEELMRKLRMCGILSREYCTGLLYLEIKPIVYNVDQPTANKGEKPLFVSRHTSRQLEHIEINFLALARLHLHISNLLPPTHHLSSHFNLPSIHLLSPGVQCLSLSPLLAKASFRRIEALLRGRWPTRRRSRTWRDLGIKPVTSPETHSLFIYPDLNWVSASYMQAHFCAHNVLSLSLFAELNFHLPRTPQEIRFSVKFAAVGIYIYLSQGSLRFRDEISINFYSWPRMRAASSHE